MSTSHSRSREGSDLPSDLAQNLDQAREFYKKGNYRDSLRRNREVSEQADRRGIGLGRILGRRFAGLCHYRLDEFPASEGLYDEALTLAKGAGEIEQALLIQNHLGATLRSSGRLLLAYKLFKEAVSEAEINNYPIARARLLANFGALLDELGERDEADRCYARYEALVNEHGGGIHQQANALALTGRSALKRGGGEGLATAREKFEEELRLANMLGEPLRQVAATLHLAAINRVEGRLSEASQLCEAALDMARRLDHKRRLADALEEKGLMLHALQNLGGAMRTLDEAVLVAQGHREKRAHVYASMVPLCLQAGLNAEAFWYLHQAVTIRSDLYKPLRAEPELAHHGAKRLKEMDRLRQEVDKLEAGRERPSPDWQHRMREVAVAVHGEALPTPAGGASIKQIKEESRARLKLLMEDDFEQLHPDSQDELVHAEVDYHSDSNQLREVARKCAVVLERELRSRDPEPKTKKDYYRGLSELIERLAERIGETWPREVRKIRDLDDGTEIDLVDARNSGAHGKDDGYRDITLLQVDAIKRALFIHPGVLHLIVQLPRLP